MRTPIAWIATSLMAVFLTLHLSPAVAAEPAASSVPSEWRVLHDRWQAAVEELKIPGLAVVAVRGDEVVLLDTFGVCDPDGKQAVTPRSPFYLASVTKSFTALGVAILADEGKLGLDDPVKKYLPRFTLADKQLAETITVRDLLCHRYGLDSSPISMAEAYFGNITDDRYFALLEFVEPREKFAYSNLHYTLAGRIIEAVSGARWQDFLAAHVFAPLQMRDATCYASKLYANPLAAWPVVEEHGQWQLAPLIKNDAVMHAAGGTGASATDLAHWLRFQLTGHSPDGRPLISTGMLKQVHAQQVADDSDVDGGPEGVTRDGYSLGWFTGTFHGRPMLTHGGGYLGTATYVSFLPEQYVGVAVLMNEGPPNGMFPLVVAQDVYGKLLNEPLPDLLPEAREIASRVRRRLAAQTHFDWRGIADGSLSQSLNRYAGRYENPLWGELRITASDEGLHLHVGELELRCHGLDVDKFRLELPTGEALSCGFGLDGQQNVRVVVVETPDGEAEFRKLP